MELWENAIKPDTYPDLIGANLKIETAQLSNNYLPNPNAYLKCQMNGYYGGTETELKSFIKNTLGEEVLKRLSFKQDRIKDANNVSRNYSIEYAWHFESWDRNNIKLDQDGPAPHKITSRLANSNNEDDTIGWDDTSRKALICSLQSSKRSDELDADMRWCTHLPYFRSHIRKLL
ncbi:MAG: hypothetical protein HRT69_15615 [Flavobacteriaceae bacterium]|nr:hypothetical protein [Flavobacteriaceae bacterium]